MADFSTGEFLALDPSIRSAGVAVFRGGALARSGVVRLEPDPNADIAARCLRMAQEIVAWTASVKAFPTAVLVEWPQWYPVGRNEVNPNDLAGLAGVSGAVVGLLQGVLTFHRAAVRVASVSPRGWAGTLPKTKTVKGAKHSPRAVRILERLSDAEIQAGWLEANHDAIDAIGIGLHALGRMEPRHVYPGASPG